MDGRQHSGGVSFGGLSRRWFASYAEGDAWPGGWMAVGEVDNYAEIGAVYDVRLDYADGTFRTLNFTHDVV